MQKILELRKAQVQPDHTPVTIPSIIEQPVPDPDSSTTPIVDDDDDDEDTTPKSPIETTPPVSPPAVLPINHTNEPKARHVLIVDDNEINLKVSLHVVVFAKPILNWPRSRPSLKLAGWG